MGEIGFQPEHRVAVHEILYGHPTVLYVVLYDACIILRVLGIIAWGGAGRERGEEDGSIFFLAN